MTMVSPPVSIAALLGAASRRLPPGELLQVSGFSLFEAMSAMEIGHPKMDPGARAASEAAAAAAAQPQQQQHQRPEESLKQQLERLDISSSEGAARLLRVLDHLLALEATHYSGGGLANTVYSSRFMMEIASLSKTPVLQSFCMGVQECCLEANYLVMQGCACEEEDFNVHLGGLPLEAAAADATAAPQALNKRTAACVDALNKQIDALDISSSSSSKATGLALADRLLFRRELLRSLSAFRGKQKADLAAGAKALQALLAQVARVRATVDLASPSAEPVPGFDPNLNNHLTPPSPPRQLKVLSTAEGLDFFERLANELLHVTTIPAAIHDFSTLKDFIENFAHARPLSLSRSALHLQLAPRSWEGNQGPPPRWALSADMLHAAMFGLPAAGEVDGAPEAPSSADMDTLLEQAVIAVGNWVQATLLNRSRQRRRLRRGCEDMANLYQHALNAEACPLAGAKLVTGGWRWRALAPDDPQGPLATWVEKETAWSMASHLLLGFELELYEPSEVPMLMWYVDFLLANVSQDVTALAAARPQQQQHPEQHYRQQYREQVTLDAMRALSQGLFRLSLALNVCGAVPETANDFASAEERFELRFGFFAATVERPDPVSFAQYQASIDLTGLPVPRLLELARESFIRAKGVSDVFLASKESFENEACARQFQNMARVARANAVAATMAGKLPPGAFSASYEMKADGGLFPVVTLKSKKKK